MEKFCWQCYWRLKIPNPPLVANIHITKSSNGWLHVVWNVVTKGGEGRGIYYARTKNGDEWSEPILLAQAEEGYGTQTPAIIEHDSVIQDSNAGYPPAQQRDKIRTCKRICED